MNNNIQKYPCQVNVIKKAEMVYFSQLDLVRIFERALRRSNLPLYFSCGFKPRVKISFMAGLKLGLEGQIPIIFYFTSPINPQELKDRLNAQLPAGLEVL